MTVSVGIAKMNEWETFDELKQRAIKNLKNVEIMTTFEKDEKIIHFIVILM